MKELKLVVQDRGGSVQEVTARPGDVVMAVLRDQVDSMIGTCGGVISCGTCHILLDETSAARLPPASDDELEMLEAIGGEAGSRLSCQLVVTEALDGLHLTIAPEA